MSTTSLTLIAFIAVILLCVAVTCVAIWRHQAVSALASAGITLIVAHLGLLVMAWSSVVGYYVAANQFVPEDTITSDPQWPAWGGFATWIYNLPALIGLGMLMLSGVITLYRLTNMRVERARLEQAHVEPAAASRSGALDESRA
jgi:hypothetical protein